MAVTDRDNANYAGDIFLLGKTQAPLLSAMLGIGDPNIQSFDLNSAVNSGLVRLVNSPYYSTAQPVSLTTPSQAVVSETASLTPTPTTVTRGEDTNVIEIHQKVAQVTYAKQSSWGIRAGINTNEPYNPLSELDFQITANMRQIAADIDFSLVKGTYQAPANAATAGQTRGLENAISTNTTAAGSIDLSRDLINASMAQMRSAGATMDNLVAIGGTFQMQRIDSIYGFAVQSTTAGGTAINTVSTPHGSFRVMYDPNVTTTSLIFADLAYCRLVILPINGQYMVIEDLAKTGAAEGKQMYIQVGMDYGAEEYHSIITGLTDS